MEIEYPDLTAAEPSPSPQKRRQTIAPSDFTFRAGQSIAFGSSSPGSTIRAVSAEPDLPVVPPTAKGSKKRKFDFENEHAAEEKENTPEVDEEEQRPAKRAKSAVASPIKPAPGPAQASRLPTLGVKPKGVKGMKDKRPSTISQARLNALAQPKKRG